MNIRSRIEERNIPSLFTSLGETVKTKCSDFSYKK